jgi:hypothetical protein
MRTIVIAIAAALVACSEASTKDNPCPQGICTNGGDDAGGGGGDGAKGGDDGGGGGCKEAWQCGPWQKQQDGSYTRTCTDTNHCGTTSNKPSEGPVNLPDLDMNFYKCKVEPIVDRGCAFMNCHGTETGRAYKVYARGRLRRDQMVPPPGGYSCLDNGATVPLKQGIGTDMCEGWFSHTTEEWQSNYDNARFFMVGLQPSQADQSDMIAQPMYGGKAHAGVHLFKQGDAEYQTLHDWLSGAGKLASCDPSPN